MKNYLKDKKCSIFGLVQGVDAYGAPFETFQEIANNIWCFTKQLSQDAVWEGMQHGTLEKRLFIINYHSGIATGQLIEYNNIRYEITRVDTHHDYKGDMFIYAKDIEQ